MNYCLDKLPWLPWELLKTYFALIDWKLWWLDDWVKTSKTSFLGCFQCTVVYLTGDRVMGAQGSLRHVRSNGCRSDFTEELLIFLQSYLQIAEKLEQCITAGCTWTCVATDRSSVRAWEKPLTSLVRSSPCWHLSTAREHQNWCMRQWKRVWWITSHCHIVFYIMWVWSTFNWLRSSKQTSMFILAFDFVQGSL